MIVAFLVVLQPDFSPIRSRFGYLKVRRVRISLNDNLLTTVLGAKTSHFKKWNVKGIPQFAILNRRRSNTTRGRFLE